MPTSPGQRFVRRHNAARSSTANGTAADIAYDTAVISEGGYSWASPEVTVDEAGLYLMMFDLGLVDLASTRACGTLVPAINGTQQTRFRATHRYLRNSGGNDGCSYGAAILNLSASDDVKVRNPGALAPTDAVNNYATAAGESGGFQMIRLPATNFTHLERTSDAAEVGTSNINTTRPWLDSSGTWTTITYNSEVNDDDALYPGTGGDATLAANTKYLVVWGFTPYSTDGSRHAYAGRLQIGGTNVQSGSSYQRNIASQGPPIVGMYLHETGGSTETCRVQATHETEGGDAGTPQIADAYLQILELPSSAEWIHVDNGATDSLTTALAGTTTWYDTPLSSTLRADGDSNLSLDGTNNAVQNDSGGSLPVLAIGWQRWDRDSGASGTRKAPMLRWDNGGSAVQYGNNSAFSRGQQSSDDTFQAHVVSAVTVDLANGADLSLQVTDRHSGSNADMGVYASTSRYFLGVQVLNLNTLDAGSGTDDLLADDVQSTSEVSAPAVGQEHALLADDAQSTSEVTSPALTEVTANWVGAPPAKAFETRIIRSRRFQTPPAVIVSEPGADVLLADDVESASEVTLPVVGQTHGLLADDVQSISEVSAPAVGQEHALLADDVESATELTQPALSESNALLADDVESASEVSAPSVGQVHALLANDSESASNVFSPEIGQTHALTPTSAESASELSLPGLSTSGTNDLLADDLESASEVSAPSVGQEHGLTPSSVESAPEVSSPVLAEIGTDDLLADDVQATSEVTAPSLAQVHDLTPTNLESASETSTPALAEVYNLNATDAVSATELSTPDVGQVHALTALSAESASEVSGPTLAQVYVLSATSVESASEVSEPALGSVVRRVYVVG